MFIELMRLNFVSQIFICSSSADVIIIIFFLKLKKLENYLLVNFRNAQTIYHFRMGLFPDANVLSVRHQSNVPQIATTNQLGLDNVA